MKKFPIYYFTPKMLATQLVQSQEQEAQCREPVTEAVTCCHPGCALAGSWNQECSRDSSPGTSVGDAGVPVSSLGPVPNALHPLPSPSAFSLNSLMQAEDHHAELAFPVVICC